MQVDEADFQSNFGGLTLVEQKVVLNFFKKKFNRDVEAKTKALVADLEQTEPNIFYDKFIEIEAPESFVLADFLSWCDQYTVDELAGLIAEEEPE
jgi:hypothetical protein